MTLARALFKAAPWIALGQWLNHEWFSQRRGLHVAFRSYTGAGLSLVTWRSIHGVTLGTYSKGGQLWNQTELNAPPGPANLTFP